MQRFFRGITFSGETDLTGVRRTGDFQQPADAFKTVAHPQLSRRKPEDRFRGTALLPSRQSYLPLKLNAGGVMPIIFASALIFLPITIANFTQNLLLIKAASSLNPGSSNPWPYAITFFALILGFRSFIW